MKKSIYMLSSCILIMIILAVGCSKQEKIKNDTEETFSIATRYCTISYPKKWKDAVQIDIEEGDVYSVKFSADDIPLFDLSFNGGDGNVLGTLKNKKENIIIRITTYDINKDNGNYEDYAKMQNDINVIIEHLISEYDFVADEIVENEDDSVYKIKTSVATLFYPEKWKDSVTIKKSEKSIKFSCNGTKLFDLLFDGTEGYLLGTYNNTEIRIVSYDIEEEKFSDSEFVELRAMQEGVNVIIDYLVKDKNFAIN